MKQGWEIKKLGEVCDIINGFAFKSNLFTDEGEDILRISNIQNGYVDLTDIAHFSKDDYPKTNFEKYAVLPNDIVVALSGATTGKFGINKTGKKLYLNQRVAICRESSSELNHLFLLYYLLILLYNQLHLILALI
jgi:type I restriction enzyme S subunit